MFGPHLILLQQGKTSGSHLKFCDWMEGHQSTLNKESVFYQI
jgi:hypothetical protein